jgi:hypothetical protein
MECGMETDNERTYKFCMNHVYAYVRNHGDEAVFF